MTKIYNDLDDRAYEELAKLHKQLDEAVSEAYGWPKSIAQDTVETNARLLELNHKIADGEIPYAPFSYLSEDAVEDA
ncbi:MAG: hypothetical protein ACSLFF_01105 [Solirubrobacterales bacterium]